MSRFGSKRTRALPIDIEELVEYLNDSAIKHGTRAEIGEKLDQIGDSRPGVGLRPDGLLDIEWCSVPGGEVIFEMFVPDNCLAFLRDAQYQPVELGKKIYRLKFLVEPFYIAKYPVTVQQFQAFLDIPNGATNDAWWYTISSTGCRGIYRQKIEKPHTIFGNHPRDNISWYQSVAFTRWLNKNLPSDARPHDARGDEWGIRLPTEWEWQQASNGGDARRPYPWGKWNKRYANTYHAGLKRTVAVGLYPFSKAPTGALDMSGNVKEWCLNKRSATDEINFFDASEDLWQWGARTYRGGSFNSSRFECGCIPPEKPYTYPSLISPMVGFRCALARKGADIELMRAGDGYWT